MGEIPAFAKDLLRNLWPAVAGIRVPKSVKETQTVRFHEYLLTED